VILNEPNPYRVLGFVSDVVSLPALNMAFLHNLQWWISVEGFYNCYIFDNLFLARCAILGEECQNNDPDPDSYSDIISLGQSGELRSRDDVMMKFAAWKDASSNWEVGFYCQEITSLIHYYCSDELWDEDWLGEEAEYEDTEWHQFSAIENRLL